jgi:hypothetical protein
LSLQAVRSLFRSLAKIERIVYPPGSESRKSVQTTVKIQNFPTEATSTVSVLSCWHNPSEGGQSGDVSALAGGCAR